MQLVSSAKVGTVPLAATSQGASGAFHRRRLEGDDPGAGFGDEQAPLAFELRRKRLRLDLNHAVPPAHLERRPAVPVLPTPTMATPLLALVSAAVTDAIPREAGSALDYKSGN
jgi:hypothetical protein